MTSQVIRIRTRETLCHPDVASLVMRGADRARMPSSGAVIAELIRDVAAPSVGIFVGFEVHDPKTLVVCHMPTSAFHLAPMITLAYSDGVDRALVISTGRRLRKWIMAEGYDHALTMNMNHADRAFMRGLGHFGVPKRVGGVIRFNLEGHG